MAAQRAVGWPAEAAAEIIILLLAAASLSVIARTIASRWVAIAISLIAAIVSPSLKPDPSSADCNEFASKPKLY